MPSSLVKKTIVLGLHVVSEFAKYAIIKGHSRSFYVSRIPREEAAAKAKKKLEEKKSGKKKDKKVKGCITAGNEPTEP
jgi:hypothetical protein